MKVVLEMVPTSADMHDNDIPQGTARHTGVEEIEWLQFAQWRPAEQGQHWKAKCELALAVRSLGFLNNWE